MKNKKNIIVIKPLSDNWLIYIFILLLCLPVFLFACVDTVMNDKKLGNIIASIVFLSLLIIIIFLILIYYFLFRIYIYDDRCEKYNLFRRKKIYYYIDLISIDYNKDWFILCKGNKKVVKLNVLNENVEVLIKKYNKFLRKNNKNMKKII